MKDEIKFVRDTMKKVYGINDLADEDFLSDEDNTQVDDDKVAALIAKHDKEKGNNIKTKSFDDGAKAREKKLKGDLENSIKEKFGITDFQGNDFDELLDHAVSLQPAGKPGTLTNEEIEKLPFVIALKKNHQTALQAKETEWNEKLTAKEREQSEKQLFSKVSTKAIELLNSKKPKLPEKQELAQRRINKDLVEELQVFGWLEQDGDLIPLDKEGKQLTTDNNVLVSFDDLVERIASENFEFEEEDSTPKPPVKKGGGLGKQPEPKQNDKPAYTGKIPDNEKDYLALIGDRSLSVEQRASIRDQYKKKKGL